MEETHNLSAALRYTTLMLRNFSTTPFPGIRQYHPQFDVEPFKLTMAILYGVIFLIGVPGNILVILTIIRVPKMRSTKNLFIANLAIGDLTNMLWCLPTALISLYISWPYGQVVCKYIFPLADVIIGNTIFTMVSIALDRYRAIVNPFTAKPTLRKTIVIIVVTWFLSYALMGLPLVLAFKVSKGYWVELSCNLAWKSDFHKLFYRLGTCTVLFCIPFVVVLFCYVRIKLKLEENIRFARESIRGRSTLLRAKRNKKLINMFLVIFLCFTSCFLPINVLLLTVTFHQGILLWKYAGIVVQFAVALLFLNSIMNPIILYRLSKDFKIGFYEQLLCVCPKTRQLDETISVLRRRLSTASSLLSVVSFRSFRTSQDRVSMSAVDELDFVNVKEQDASEPPNRLVVPSKKSFSESSESLTLLPKVRTGQRKSVTWFKDDVHGSLIDKLAKSD
ncbi:QRFP-like peptide receptor [Hydractinia symbiolongicarpus]|uniref:QRFP-like peptide receptor n=1 Tax=Hydractinia symbiolongicarpus TaxID=13093 RepID=UPI002549F27B|nr:QRFP-like peptide receptor [Hydractinia symbiolongicarpus]